MNLPSLLKVDRAGAIALLMLIIFSYLSLLNLNALPLWDDEAVQAFIARNLLETGLPTVWDGRNLFADANGKNITSDLRQIYPQLVYYTKALVFWLLGDSPASGRLISALFGITSMFIVWRILCREFSTRPRLVLMAFALTCFSPLILLHVRQLQYYAESLFFNVLLFWLYLCYLERRQTWIIVAITVVAILSFHANYLTCAAFLISLAVMHFSFYARSLNLHDYICFAVASIVWIATAAPALAFLTGFTEFSGTDPLLRMTNALTAAIAHIFGLNRNAVLPWPIFIWLFWFVINYLRKIRNTPSPTTKNPTVPFSTAGNEPIMRYACITLIYVIIVGIATSSHTYYHWRGVSARYLVPIVPFTAIVCSAAADWLMKKTTPLWGWLLFAVMLLSNVLSVPFINHIEYGNKPLLTLPLLVREIHQSNRTTGVSISVDYLAQHAKQNDSVLTLPHHYANPLRYHLGDKLLICCLLDENSHLHNRFKQYPYLFKGHSPNWIIGYGYPITTDDLNSINKSTGKQYLLRIAFPIYENGLHPQRPEPTAHIYEIPKTYDPNYGVYIYHAEPTLDSPSELTKKSPTSGSSK